ncbi:MAG: hypothetical protein E6706_00930 [Anaerococcus hydrogenalis]|nr:hypothetical protein [Anaerococcus hydrogenalis]
MENSSINSFGNPFGKVGMGVFEIIPAISQCPVVVSFPFEASAIFAKEAIGFFTLLSRFTPSILNKPNFSRFGQENFGLL